MFRENDCIGEGISFKLEYRTSLELVTFISIFLDRKSVV